jgi:DNA-binding IclR family transcriptional regulator
MGDKAKHPVKATVRTLEIIAALKQLNWAGVTELADRLDTSKSVVHNHLSTLKEHDYVVKGKDGYSLGLRFLEMGGYRRNKMTLYRIGKPEVDAMAKETGELVNIAVEEHGQCVYLYRSRGAQSVHLDIHAGERAAMNTTALGKSMLAFMNDDRVDRIIEDGPLPATTKHSFTDPKALREELAATRERGYAIDDEERLEGLRCVSAPIRQAGEVLGAISVSAPTNRLKGDRLEQTVPDKVVSAANVIELNSVRS